MWTLVVLCFWVQALLHTTVRGLRIQGSSLVDSNGQNVELYGFNSFGMNNQRTCRANRDTHQTPTDIRATATPPNPPNRLTIPGFYGQLSYRTRCSHIIIPACRNHVGWNVVQQSPLG